MSRKTSYGLLFVYIYTLILENTISSEEKSPLVELFLFIFYFFHFSPNHIYTELIIHILRSFVARFTIV